MCHWGSRVGAVVRTFAFHQGGPSPILSHCHMWAEFVVGSCLALSFFFFSFKKEHLQIPIQQLKQPT